MENTHPTEGFADSKEKIENSGNSSGNGTQNGAHADQPEPSAEESAAEPEATASDESPSTSGMIPEQETPVEEPVLEVPDIALPTADLPMDEHHDEEHVDDDLHEDESVDFSAMGREELVAYVKDAHDKQNERDINKKVQVARAEFNRKTKETFEEKEPEAAAAAEEGETPAETKISADTLSYEFQSAFKAFKKRRQDYINELNHQKDENLKLKKELLEKIKTLTEHPETPNSFNQFKDLQAEWRKIGHVPITEAENIWNTYNYYIDRFYEQRSLYSEFKELDRKRNLAAKEEVVGRIENLLQVEDTNEALKQLRHFQEEWRHIGPVPKEQLEPIIQRYKQAVISLYEKKEAHNAELQAVREQNHAVKSELLEKIEEIANTEFKSVQEWINGNTELGKWLENWRGIGAVPAAKGAEMKDRLSNAIRKFNNRKNEFFRGRKKEKVDSLRRKTELCERVEAILQEPELPPFRKEVIKLQEDWKKAGPVPAKYSDKIWKRFQAACDAFFSKISESHNAQHQEQQDNLNKKVAAIEKAEALAKEEKPERLRERIREIQQEFNAIGFVPFKEKEKIRKRFSAVMDTLFNGLRAQHGESVEGEKMNYQMMLESWSQEGGRERIQNEERKHQRDLKRIENEIATLENNMAFLSKSKTADTLKAGLEKQLVQLRQKMEEIQGKIKLVRSVGR
jgi:hypothetical protein